MRKWVPLWVRPILVVMLCGAVWLRLSIVSLSYGIDQMDRQLVALHQANEQMALKVAELRSPRRLEKLAHERFGLSQPRADQVIRLTGNKAPQGEL